MAFSDYIDLRTAVIEEVKRPDIADVFPRLTLLAEAKFNRDLSTRDQITTATLTFTNGIAPLPPDFLEVVGLYNGSGYEYVQQTLQETRPTGPFYSIIGSNLHAGLTTAELQYYSKIPTITGSLTASNWLLQKFPSVYLYGVGLEAAKYLRDADLSQALGALLAEALREVRADDERARYSRARVRVQGVTP